MADSASPSVLRVASASYIASFLVCHPMAAHTGMLTLPQARASFLPPAFVVEQLSRLCNWSLEYTERSDEQVCHTGASTVFEAVCQARFAGLLHVPSCAYALAT